jgi:exodeoxyribonuclease VIII
MKLITDPVHLSNLKKFGESPAHYFDSIGKDVDKASFRIGRLTHALLLGVQPGGRWDIYKGRRAGKEWEAFRDARPGVDIFTTPEHALALAMAKSVERTPLAFDLLQGEFEVPVEWTHETGRRCATRGLDILNRKLRYTGELKTAVTSHPGRFTREALRMGYHAQGAWAKEAAASLGVDVDNHFIIAVEKKAPHVVTVLRLAPRALLQGQKLCRSWMEQLDACEKANVWPGYCQSVVDLDVPEEDDGIVFDGDEADDETEEAA